MKTAATIANLGGADRKRDHGIERTERDMGKCHREREQASPQRDPHLASPSSGTNPVVLRLQLNVKPNAHQFNQNTRLDVSYLLRGRGEVMDYKKEDLETLRLLRAFHKIKDAAMRRAIVKLVEQHAAGRKPEDDPPAS
jgi:hypothetical protein